MLGVGALVRSVASSGTMLRGNVSGACGIAPRTLTHPPSAETAASRCVPGVVNVKIHEYQAKDILRRYGIPVHPGKVATTPEEPQPIARELGVPVVIKAQAYAARPA